MFHVFFLSAKSNLNGHKHLIGYVDSSVTLRDAGVHEVLLLMPYHKTTLLQMMNERLSKGKIKTSTVAKKPNAFQVGRRFYRA